jgi:hypothetical protein
MTTDNELVRKQSIMDQFDRCRSLAHDLSYRLRQLEQDIDALFQIERSVKPGGE